MLKLSEQIPLGGDSKDHWPTLGLNTLRWAKKQGAVTGTAHSGAGLERSVGRVPGEDGPHMLPGFDISAFDGIGANEFIAAIFPRKSPPFSTGLNNWYGGLPVPEEGQLGARLDSVGLA